MPPPAQSRLLGDPNARQCLQSPDTPIKDDRVRSLLPKVKQKEGRLRWSAVVGDAGWGQEAAVPRLGYGLSCLCLRVFLSSNAELISGPFPPPPWP